MSRVDISLVMLSSFYRESIMRKLWSRRHAIKYNRLKYISKPYTFKDLELAIEYDNYDLVVLFYDKVIMNNKFEPFIIQNCKSVKTFEFLLNHMAKFYTEEEIDNILNTYLFTFIKKGSVDIVRFLDNKNYKIMWYKYEINHLSMIEYFFEKTNKVYINTDLTFILNNVNIHNCSSNIKKWLYENEKCDYNLEDAILDEDIEMIDYFLDDCEVQPSKDNIIDLINMNYEGLDLIREIPYIDDDICQALIEGDNMESIESMINNGLIHDQLINYCIDKGYDEMESTLYNF